MKDIKEAIKLLSHRALGDEAIRTLISLAERVENIKGLPKKKEEKLIKNKIANALQYYRNTKENTDKAIAETVNNLYCLFTSIDDCKLYIAKMLDEERIEKIIQRSEYGKFANFGFSVARKTSTQGKTMVIICGDLAQAIVKEPGET